MRELTVPVRQGLAFLRLGLSASWSADYKTWRNSFLRNRLRLTLWMALSIVLTLIILFIGRTTVDKRLAWL